ncbi:MAG: glycerophosphodiester phosphodiesterase [bacterium]
MMRIGNRVGIVVCLVAVSTLLWSACGDDDGTAEKPFFQDLPARVHLAHRGGAKVYPESTLYAFEHVIDEYQTDVLEIDLVMSADGHIMVTHDEEVDNTTDGTGNVNDMTLAELKELDAGYWFDPDEDGSYPHRGTGLTMPTLEETFEAFPAMHYNLEIKDYDNEYEEDLYAVVQQYNMEDLVIWGSFDKACTLRLRALAPHVAVYAPFDDATCFGLAVLDEKDPLVECTDFYDALNISAGLAEQEVVEVAHSMGIKVFFWTIDDRSQMETLFGYGADGIITDRPDILREVIDSLQ